MSAGRNFILNNFKAERILQSSAYSCTELVIQEGIPYVRKTINAVGLPYAELKNIIHPCLPHIFYAVEDEGKTYVIEEYISGRTLKECLEQKVSFNSNQQKNIARQLCSVLELLHGKGILHRDIKPSNIIVMHDLQQVKLIDFGIGRSFNAEGDNSAQDTCIMGTPGYAPPEQYGFSTTDQRSDIYSLGKTLLDLQNKSSDSNFISILKKCTEFDPAKRYQNPEEFRLALEEKKNISLSKIALYSVAFVVTLIVGYCGAKMLFNKQPNTISESQLPQSSVPLAEEQPQQSEKLAPLIQEPKKQLEQIKQPVPREQKQVDKADLQVQKQQNNSQVNQIERDLALLGKVKLKQVGYEWWFSKNSLKVVNEKDSIYCFNGIDNRGPLVVVENDSDYIAENPEIKLELYSFGMLANDFSYKTDANHTEQVVFSRIDRLGVARRVSIKLAGTIPPHTKYTFSALQNVKDFYMYYKGDHGTILGSLNCKHMIPQSVGYTFNLK